MIQQSDQQAQLMYGDCLEQLQLLADNSVDAVVTDPPYGLSKEPDIAEVMMHWCNDKEYNHKSNGFMGKSWDSFVPSPEYWREIYRVLKPGGHALVFAGTRTQDLMSISLRFAGFEVRDTLMWVYGSGFPKSLNISKALDKQAGVEREVIGINASAVRVNSVKNHMNGQVAALGLKAEGSGVITAPATEAAKQWDGWGTALKPAYEPIIMVRKPLEGTVAENVLKWGVGGLNIDASRVPMSAEDVDMLTAKSSKNPTDYDESLIYDLGMTTQYAKPPNTLGRFPANLIHDGSEEVLEGFPKEAGAGGRASGKTLTEGSGRMAMAGKFNGTDEIQSFYNDKGSAARFFYCAKTSKKDRGEGNNHPTVKPTDLMQYLCRLITPTNGTILDPFMGSGSTGKAALLEGFKFIGIERDQSYFDIAKERVKV